MQRIRADPKNGTFDSRAENQKNQRKIPFVVIVEMQFMMKTFVLNVVIHYV